MKREFEQDTLEIPTVGGVVETKRTSGLINSIDLSAVGMKHLHSKDGVHSYHETCNHPGVPCGDDYHRGSGHGYCYYCSLCN